MSLRFNIYKAKQIKPDIPDIAHWVFADYLFVVFAVFAGVFILYHLYFYVRLILYKDAFKNEQPEPVSVIIASRDDAKRLRAFLPAIMAQKGVEFEVIVVDDCSWDDTQDVLREFEAKYENFRHSRLVEQSDFDGGKKYAVTIGIKAANYEHLVFTDADCYPDSEDWLRKMAIKLQQKKVVLGYSPYQKAPGFLNKLIRYDAFKIGLNYLSFALGGFPYMGVGRNLGYHAFLYFKVKGFSSHLDLASGDDDLLVNAVADRKNTGIVIDPDTFVYSLPKKTFKLWWYQKQRHLSTAGRYRLIHRFLLILLPMSQYIMNGALIALLVLQYKVTWVLGVYGAKVFIQLVVMLFAMRRLKALDLLIWSWLLELCLLIFYPVITLLKIVKGKQSKRWM